MPQEQSPFNKYGGLTIVTTPGYKQTGAEAKKIIEARTDILTPTDLVHPEFGIRSNGEPVIRLAKEHIGGHDCVALTSGPGTYEMLGQLLFLLGYLKGRRAGRITVITGYLPLGRSDKDEGQLELPLAPHPIRLMQAAAEGELNRVITYNLHCPQLTMIGGMGLITEVSIIRRVIKKAIEEATKTGEKICIFFPDEGARKQFEDDLDAVCAKLGIQLPRVYGTKRRQDDKAIELTGLHGNVDQISGSLVITIDDEIATTSTNVATAQAAKIGHQAKFCWGVTAHGVLCGKAVEILSASGCPLDKIFITDSISVANRPQLAPLIENGRIEIVSLLEDLAHIIFYHHWDTSIREKRG